MKERCYHEKDDRNRHEAIEETQEAGKTGKYRWKTRIHTEAHLDDWLKDCFGGLDMTHQEDGTTLISGTLPDLPDLYGLMLQLRDTGIMLISLRVERESWNYNETSKKGEWMKWKK